jgi:hypothetical protein
MPVGNEFIGREFLQYRPEPFGSIKGREFLTGFSRTLLY